MKQLFFNLEKLGSLDPGVITFQTAYTGNGVYKFDIHKRKIKKLQEKLDLFKSLRDTGKIKRKAF